MDKRPIGVFDSGVGGLTVVKKLKEILPCENIVYLGDTARVPYGNKSKDTVTRFAVECVKFLKSFNIKLLVVACNTASSWSINTLKKSFSFPVIGVIRPAVEEACKKTRKLKIGVIGTKATIKSASYINEIRKINTSIKIYQKPCPLFVPLVEEGLLKEKITFDVVSMYLEELRSKNIDTLILGCTHYPLLKGTFKKFFKTGTNIIDSSLSVSEEIKNFLRKNDLENIPKEKAILRFFVTDDPEYFKKISKIFLKKDIKVKRVELL